MKQILLCQRKVSELNGGFTNPRKVKKEDLVDLQNSLESFGDFGVIVIDENNQIIAGNQRISVLQKIKPETLVDCKQLIGYTDEEKKLINMRANNHTGTWDEKELEKILSELSRLQVNISLSGLDELDLEELGIDLSATSPINEENEDIVPEVTGQTKTKPGDIIELGRHRLICGDSTDPVVLAELFGDDIAAMMFTDPPYNCDYTDVRGRKIKNDKFKGDGFLRFLTAFFRTASLHVEGDIYACMSGAEMLTLRSAFEASGGKYSDFLIWVKNQFVLSRSNYQRQYEVMLYGWYKKSSHYWAGRRNLSNVIRDEIRRENDEYYLRIKGTEFETNIWEHDRPVKNEKHPTMKPVGLVQRAIVNSSRLNDIVFDGFLGSGSTLIAAEKTGRVCYGVELDPQYCDVIVARWKNF